jgi:hypothetical protein
VRSLPRSLQEDRKRWPGCDRSIQGLTVGFGVESITPWFNSFDCCCRCGLLNCHPPLAGVLTILGVNEGASASAVTKAMEVATKRNSHQFGNHGQHHDYGQQDQLPYLKHPMCFSLKEQGSLLHHLVITQ